jgi:alkylated DNA nucleotide flippase Atl1
MRDEYVEAVLELVERIPPGRVMSYGAIAEYLGEGGPRQVGAVMSHHGGPVPWHRVVAANGRLVPGHEIEARRRHTREGTPFRGDKVDMRTAAWWPE